MHERQRRGAIALCGVSIASLLLAASVALATGVGSVRRRPWPPRVAATRPWVATMRGEGDRLTLTVGGVVEGGLGHAVVDVTRTFPRLPPLLGSNIEGRQLQLPDGSRWRPTKPFRLEGSGDVPFGAERPLPAIQTDEAPFVALRGHGSSVAVEAPSLEAVLATARSGVVAVGAFTGGDGKTVDRLNLPPSTLLVGLCPRSTALDPPGGCLPTSLEAVAVTITVVDGLTIRASGEGEAAVAGTATAEALGQSWKGQVGAVEATGLAVRAVRGGGRWKVTVNGQGARQLWIDVWPVVDTVLQASSSPAAAALFGSLSPLSTRIQVRNVGFATSQIYAAEGTGDDAKEARFDLNKSLGHDAGLGVRRGDKIKGLSGGGDVDSNLPPQGTFEEKLTALTGGDATITLRGNFPDLSVRLVTVAGGARPGRQDPP